MGLQWADRTGQDKIGQDRAGQDRTGLGRKGQEGQDRTGVGPLYKRTCHRFSFVGFGYIVVIDVVGPCL